MVDFITEACWTPDHLSWLRTNGVNTNVATAKIVNFAGLGKRVYPGTFGNIQMG